MVKCGFCGEDSSQYTGLHLLKNDGTVVYFCSSKCRKNSLKLKRDKKRFKWTAAYGIEAAETAERKVRQEESNKEANKQEAKREEAQKEKKAKK
jgi:large subunit ribosomal protein L24e